MKFQDYLNNAWSIHPTESEKLLNEFQNHFSLIESVDDFISLAHLIVHVSGEHLGKWKEGIEVLNTLKRISEVQDQAALDRYLAILSLGMNSQFSIRDFTVSDQVRILAITASALASQNEIRRAGEYLKQAHELAQLKLEKTDPANRNLAITGNNLASSLEEKENRTDEEAGLMIEAALIGRKFWEIAGTWKEIERAEYRLAKTYMKAGKLDKALFHAESCLEIVYQNNNEPLEIFFGYEVLGLVEKMRGNQIGLKKAIEKMTEVFQELTVDEQSWCKGTLENF